jgi:hypothetical protein
MKSTLKYLELLFLYFGYTNFAVNFISVFFLKGDICYLMSMVTPVPWTKLRSLSHHIISHHITSYHIISYHIISYLLQITFFDNRVSRYRRLKSEQPYSI